MRRPWLLPLLLLGLCARAPAHHSFGLYDMTKSVEVTGTVEKMEWSNPHCWLFLSVKSGDQQLSYGFEMTSVGEMTRRGWKKNSLKVGEQLTIKYHPVRDGRPAGYLITATTNDGQIVGRSEAGSHS